MGIIFARIQNTYKTNIEIVSFQTRLLFACTKYQHRTTKVDNLGYLVKLICEITGFCQIALSTDFIEYIDCPVNIRINCLV